MKVGIIDYGAGNLQSVLNAFLSIGADAELITDPSSLSSLTHLVLPGQGEFGDCSAKLKAANMFDAIKKFQQEAGIKIPHMGWNAIAPTQPDHPIWSGLADAPYFYYVHSYYPSLTHAEDSACTSVHGTQKFDGAVCRDKLIATQFHPEKSQHAGLQLLKNFLAL